MASGLASAGARNVALILLLLGCGASTRRSEPAGERPDETGGADGSGGSQPGSTGGRGGSTAGGSSNGGNSPNGGAGGEEGPPTSCDAVPATSQIPRLTNEQYDRTVRDLLGVSGLEDAGGARPSTLLAADTDLMTAIGLSAYLSVAESIAAQVARSAALQQYFLGCSPSSEGSQCWSDAIAGFGRRAFRRPLSAEEMARFEAIVNRGAELTETGSDAEIAEVLLATFLVSPSFLQRAEIATTSDGDGKFVLSPYEVASRLSYLLWGTLPDRELDRAADAGELATKEQIRSQAERMLADEKARDTIQAFHRGYLRLPGYDPALVMKDPARFPAFTSGVVTAMVEEADRFVDAVVLRDRGSFADLFTSPLGFVNAETAPLYGLDPGRFGAELEEVTLDAVQRPGALTRIGFLSSTAGYGSTSPILRGIYVSKYVLGSELPSEHPVTPSPLPPPGDYTTNRQLIEALTSRPECAACHAVYLNPPGFVLEAYDAIGAFQTVDPLGGAIDTVADVLIDGEAVTVVDAADLMQRLASSEEAQRTYAERWVERAYERDDPLDDCTIDRLGAKIAEDGYTILDLMVDLTQTESFRSRVREEVSP